MGTGLLAAAASPCFGGISEASAFENLTWEKVYEEELLTPQGVLQSVCATEDYIICIENTSDEEDLPDTVSAYYRNNTDSQGNPVTQCERRRQIGSTEMVWHTILPERKFM